MGFQGLSREYAGWVLQIDISSDYVLQDCVPAGCCGDAPYYSHPTRTSARHHSLYFSQISTTKDYYKFSFFPRTIVLWNTLPDIIDTIEDLGSFKSAVTKVPIINP